MMNFRKCQTIMNHIYFHIDVQYSGDIWYAMQTCPSTDLGQEQVRAKQALERLPEDTAMSPSLRLVWPSICEAKTEIKRNYIFLGRAQDLIYYSMLCELRKN